MKDKNVFALTQQWTPSGQIVPVPGSPGEQPAVAAELELGVRRWTKNVAAVAEREPEQDGRALRPVWQGHSEQERRHHGVDEAF